MNKETFFKIIDNHFQKDEVKNYHGIIIKPYVDNDLLNFNFENPNNLSYNKTCLVNYFYDQCDFYGKILGIEESELYKNYVNMYYTSSLSDNRIYLNDADTKELTDITKKHSKKFKLNSSDYDVSLYADISIVSDIDLTSSDSESIYLNFDVLFENLTNPRNPEYDLNKNIDILIDWLYDEYRNYYDMVWDMFVLSINLIINNPLLFDDSYMYIDTNITPIVYDEEGNLVNF